MKTKSEIVKYMRTPSLFNDGLGHAIGAVTAEDDRVSMEVETKGVAPNGIELHPILVITFQ